MKKILVHSWKQYILVILLTPFFLPFFSFSQSKEKLDKQLVSLKLVYLSKESIRSTYLDENGKEHAVFNSKQDALVHIKQVYKEISDFNDLKNKSTPVVFFIWKDDNNLQDEKNEEIIFFDLENDSFDDLQLKIKK